jgi:DNA adenine methylase
MDATISRTNNNVPKAVPFKTQLLKWVGSKQKFAHEIIAHFPPDMGTYREPFLGSGAVLATLAPARAVGSDAFAPLVQIWQKLLRDPDGLKRWYSERFAFYASGDRVAQYEAIKARYNSAPNGADFLFLTRSCYGGVIRFRKKDGYMSTPCGAHMPIKPISFSKRVDMWHARMKGTEFACHDFSHSLDAADKGDLVYCDPPYADSQSILYGAQHFEISRLFTAIDAAAGRGVRIALSIDGTKKSGAHHCPIDIPSGLFKRCLYVNTGRSMLRRFQLAGQTLEREMVQDRLLLTY